MDRRPIEARVDAGRRGDRDVPGVPAEAFRDALAEWASTVTVVAVREGADVHGVTVTSFAPVSAEPPTVVVSLGPNARPLPFLETGVRFAVSLLGESQGSVATNLADTFPVGPPPFPEAGDPVVDGCVLGLVCTVRSVTPAEGGAHLVLARVEEVRRGRAGSPLLYHRRDYRRVAPP